MEDLGEMTRIMGFSIMESNSGLCSVKIRVIFTKFLAFPHSYFVE